MSSPILYGHHESGHSYKVALALSMLGLDHEYRQVDIFAAPHERAADFRARSSYGEVPMLIVDGASVVQSNAILLHLARSTGRLGGETVARYSEVQQWLFWEANRIGFSLPNYRSLKRFEVAPAPEVLAWLKARFELDAARLNAEVSQKPFVLGESLTVVDIACSAYLFLAHEAELCLDGWPALKQWLERITAQPGFRPMADLLHP